MDRRHQRGTPQPGSWRRPACFLAAVAVAMAALACGEPPPPPLGADEAANLVRQQFPEAEVEVLSVRPDEQRAIASTELDGTAVEFIFDRTEEEGWQLREVTLEGSTFAIGDLAQISDTMMTMSELATALEAFRGQRQSYPIGSGRLTLRALMPDFVDPDNEFVDAWRQAFMYSSDVGEDYTLISLGPDGQQGTKDDIVLVSGVFVGPQEARQP